MASLAWESSHRREFGDSPRRDAILVALTVLHAGILAVWPLGARHRPRSLVELRTPSLTTSSTGPFFRLGRNEPPVLRRPERASGHSPDALA